MRPWWRIRISADLGIRQVTYNCTGNSARGTENSLEFVKAHIDSITAVINGNVKGDSGPAKAA